MHAQFSISIPRFARVALPLLTLVLLVSGCRSEQKTFSTPEAAVSALVDAMRPPLNTDRLREILGPDGDEIISSGDADNDRTDFDRFLTAYDAKHSLVAQDADTRTLVVGNEDWPLPIPVVKSGSGWRFDTEEGKDEVLSRRIGRNELNAIEVCRAIVDAQNDYVAMNPNGDRAFATKFISDSGKRNGLYWPTQGGEAPSPLGSLVGDAQPQPSSTPRPYHGYYYRILTKQGRGAPGGTRDYMEGGKMTGGFAIVAFPAEYGNSGIMSFLIGKDGVLYQRDLGEATEEMGRSMGAFDPAIEWSVVP